MTAPLTDQDLERLLADLESDRVRRKRSGADRSAIRRTICAFANDLPGRMERGVLFVGVNDDGTCADLEITDGLMSTLAQMRGDGNILPQPSMVVEKRTVRGCDLVAVTVAPSAQRPVRYQGRVFIKVGPTVQLATPEEERQLTERRRASDLPFDMRPAADASLDDLDLDFVRTEYLPRAVALDILEQNRRGLDAQLAGLRCLTAGRPTQGALLGLGRDPQRWLPGAYVQFLRFDGTAATDPIRNQKELTGRLNDVLRQLDELLMLNISVRTEIKGGPLEARHPDYPIVALQQLTRNAVMHRSYEGTNAPVRVYWFNDRVEISNPGGLYGQVTGENFGQGVTDYRNPLVAELMHHMGYAQRFGVGVPLAREASEKGGNPPPEFDFHPTTVLVTLRPAP